jgi:hypothetical protein
VEHSPTIFAFSRAGPILEHKGVMRHPFNRSLQATVLAVALTATSCATKSIHNVLADPARYRDRQVQISGEVVDSYSVLGRGFYRVRDDSGQLWVMSDRGVPRDGARVKVKGTIREPFNLGSLGANLPAGVGGAVMMVENSHTVR